MVASSPRVTIVMRLVLGSCVGPTLRVSMLYPRPLNKPATRVSTPNLFSTSTEMVCRILGKSKNPRPGGNGGRPGARSKLPAASGNDDARYQQQFGRQVH